MAFVGYGVDCKVQTSGGDIYDLEFLNLQDNNLEGTVSSAIGNLTSAISIDLSFNDLKERCQDPWVIFAT